MIRVCKISRMLSYDARVFHIPDQNFINKLNLQGSCPYSTAIVRRQILKILLAVEIEMLDTNGWADKGPEVVKSEALQRLQLQGWTACRRAIVATIRYLNVERLRHSRTDTEMMHRAWILTGYIRSAITREMSVAVEFIGRALQVLRWGHEIWRDASLEDKGVIFIDSFVQGVHALYIKTYSEVRSPPW